MYLDLCYFLLEACKKLPNHTKSDKDLVFSSLDILVLIRLLIYMLGGRICDPFDHKASN